ncbi:MAG: UvrD-helicase domain-containing protein [Ramlibacter sp.]|nr:UvrD-helicase domain-containing protein [Ramlibacter sp.]
MSGETSLQAGGAPTGAPQGLAYELNGRPVSRAEFYAVACDPRRSVAVEACAGAGKTWMLVSRILRALLDGAQPQEILAITFTRKAAGEMRQRLQEWLARFAQASPDQLEQELLMRGIAPQPARDLREPLSNLYQTLLASGRPVQVRTFHGWFAALLRNAPLAMLQQLGLPAQYELLEDDSEAVDAIWRRFHGAVVRTPEARQDYLHAVAEHGRFQTQKALLAALSKRVEFALADAQGVVDRSIQPFDGPFPEFAGLATPEEAVLAQGALAAVAWDAARALGRASAPTFAAKGSELEQALTAGDAPAALAALLTQKGEPRKFSDKLAGIEQVRAAQAVALRLLGAREQHLAWQHQQRMARLSRLLIDEFSVLKRERGWIDMNDVERAALTMLCDPVLSGWVQERLDARVRHLLIDEFQDTNPLQWQALGAWLSGYAGAGAAPSVFIVGDPKQSIYRFRRAEPQVFRAAQQFVVQGLGGDLLSCDHTHRNAQRVMAVVNEVMAQAQEAGEYTGFRRHTTESAEPGAVARLPPITREAVATDASPADPLAWRDSLSVPRELPEDTLRTLECRQAAHWVAAQLSAGRPAGDIMVLARKRDRLSLMQDELRALQVAAQQPEKNDLADAPEVQDIVALLDVLVSPAHDLSLARALRSPLWSVADADLVQLALRRRDAQAAGRSPGWFDLLQKEEQLPPALIGLGAILTRWQGWVAALPPHDALDAIYHDGDVLARFAAAAPGPLRAGVLANLRAVLGAALQIDGARFLTPYALVRALRAGGVRAPRLAQTDAVSLLTVHGAKGLEAPVVLMLDTDAPAPRAETMGVLVEWPGEEAAPVRFAFLASETRAPACTALALEAERAARQREELNALYVAMTRARQMLVLSSVQPHQAAAGSWWQRLQDLAEPLPPPPVPLAASGGAQGPDTAFYMSNLPEVQASRPSDATETIADDDEDTPASRLGKAMHRLLEWASPAGPGPTAPQLHAVGREFGLPGGEVQRAAAAARRILAGQGAWAWDAGVVDWQGNEVPLHHQGQSLRLDRLVRRRDNGEWWVLDHKLASQPERQAALREQMTMYVAAVQAAHPGAAVRAAFLTGEGKLVEF